MQDPQLNLAQFGLDKLAAQAHKELTYKGLFVASETEHLAGGNYDLQKTVTYDKEDLETLLDYNIKLFTSAAEVIRSGNFAVNPYTEDGKSVQGDQIKLLLILRPTATWDRLESSCVYQVGARRKPIWS